MAGAEQHLLQPLAHRRVVFDDQNLDEQDLGKEDKNPVMVFKNMGDIQQHPHGDEKEGEETIPEGHEVRRNLVLEFRVGKDQSSGEGPQDQGKTRQLGQDGRAEA